MHFVAVSKKRFWVFDYCSPPSTALWPPTSHKATHIFTHIKCNCFRSVSLENIVPDHWSLIHDIIPLAKTQIFPHTAFCWAQMTLWCHSWGSKPPQNASHIHIICIHSFLASYYAVEGHMGAPITLLRLDKWDWISRKIGVGWSLNDVVMS